MLFKQYLHDESVALFIRPPMFSLFGLDEPHSLQHGEDRVDRVFHRGMIISSDSIPFSPKETVVASHRSESLLFTFQNRDIARHGLASIQQSITVFLESGIQNGGRVTKRHMDIGSEREEQRRQGQKQQLGRDSNGV